MREKREEQTTQKVSRILMIASAGIRRAIPPCAPPVGQRPPLAREPEDR
jgi:hypothetical protein